MDGYRIFLKAIRRASEIVGGAHPLAVRLEVEPAMVEAWLAGSAVPDEVSFLRAVDIILARDRVLPWTQAEVEADLAARRASRSS
jgi:hypothetical protein